MFTLTVTGNTTEELSNNLKALFNTNLCALAHEPQPSPFLAQPTAPTAAPTQQAPVLPANPTQQAAPTPNTYAAAQTNPQLPIAAPAVPVVATASTPPAQDATIPTFAPTANPMPGVPAAPAPTYTLDQLARAGATLAQSGKMEQALALLAKYGVQTVNQLQPEQYGAFATELRALGAQV